MTYAGTIENTIKFKSNSRYYFLKGDICDSNLLNDIFNEYSIDGVINFAAESHVDNSIENPNIFIKTNVVGVLELLKTATKFWLDDNFNYRKEYLQSRFHQVSTDEVFGSINGRRF